MFLDAYVEFRELSLSVKSEGLSLSVVFEDVTFSVGLLAVVDLSLGLVFGVNSTPAPASTISALGETLVPTSGFPRSPEWVATL